MENRIDIFKNLKNEGKLSKLWLYPKYTEVNDPYEKTSTQYLLNPIAIEAYVYPISFEALRWKYSGLIPNKSVQVIAEKKYEGLFKSAGKIKYNDENYKTWKDDSKGWMIMVKADYIVVILGLKND